MPVMFLREVEDIHAQENFDRISRVFNDLIRQVENAIVTKTFTCYAENVIGDWVRLTSGGRVLRADLGEAEDQPVIGRIIKKPAPEFCTVIMYGMIRINLEETGPVFIEPSGNLTFRPRNTAQKLGLSFGDGTMFLNPQMV